MNELACAWVRDRLPEHARDALDVAETARTEQHLATCSECRAEAALVGALAAPVPVPTAVETRVLNAVRSEPSTTVRGGAGIRHYALAASFVFAVVTGSLLWQQFGGGPGQAGPEAEIDVALAVPASADPLLHESGLQALSEDELRTLLEELEL